MAHFLLSVFNHIVALKVGTNKKVERSGRWQMFGIVLRPGPESIATLPPFDPIEGHTVSGFPDFQPMRVSEDPVCIHLFRQNSVFTYLHLRSPVHVVPPLVIDVLSFF